MALFLGYWFIPLLDISPLSEVLKEVPALVFRLDIPPVMSVMTALVLAVMLGLATVWTKSRIFETLLEHFQKNGVVINQPDADTGFAFFYCG